MASWECEFKSALSAFFLPPNITQPGWAVNAKRDGVVYCHLYSDAHCGGYGGNVLAGMAYNSSQYLQIWRWVSHAFLHFSLLHILFNLMWWWYLGGQMEKRLGTSKLLVLTIVSAVFSGWGQSLFSGANFGGLSGVVYALMGYVWLTGERAPERGISLPVA